MSYSSTINPTRTVRTAEISPELQIEVACTVSQIALQRPYPLPSFIAASH